MLRLTPNDIHSLCDLCEAYNPYYDELGLVAERLYKGDREVLSIVRRFKNFEALYTNSKFIFQDNRFSHLTVQNIEDLIDAAAKNIGPKLQKATAKFLLTSLQQLLRQ
jgi:hypothetical protein